MLPGVSPLNHHLVLYLATSLAVSGACGALGCRHQRAAPPAPPPPVVTVTRPVMYPVQTYFEYNGHLEPVEMVQVVARVEGFLNEIDFTEGDDVEEGKLLFEIDPREYQAAVKRAEADKLKAGAELRRAQSEEARVKRLRASGAISEEEYEQRVSTRETAEAVVSQTAAALEAAQLQLSYTKIHSPIHGQINRTLVTRGNLVGQTGNTLLTTIVSMDPLYVYFDAPERDLVEYQRSLREVTENEILSGTFRVEVGVASEQGYPHVGKIDFRENRVDIGTGTVRVRGRIPNPRVPPANVRILYPGLYARVRIPSGTPRPLAAIPEDALMTGQEGRFVYVLGADNVVEKRSVTVGPQVFKGEPPEGKQGWTLAPAEGAEPPAAEGDESSVAVEAPVPSVIAIESGLTTDDVIVINGLVKARPGTPVAPQSRKLRPPPGDAGK
jgi:RND family efflux transporter MFP subunit